jgi:glycosyltransferase involved in cell wall biosynthesis
MRIAVTADPELAVPPRLYGGIERIIDLLVRGLVQRGHEVTLFAHPDSVTPARLVPYRGRSSGRLADTLQNCATITWDVLGNRYDIIHSFSRLAYLTPLLPLPLPKLMTYQREVTRRSVETAHRLSRGTLQFAAVSRKMMKPVEDLGTWHLAYNGVSLQAYAFAAAVADDAPLVFLGRIERIKGAHLAIEVARMAGVPLIIAGNIPARHEDYFDAQIKPHLDGRQVTYAGPVDDRQKNALLGAARALLMPILWEEPFGIVMAEALACGTPVIGLDRGAVPEVVEDGVTGFVRQDAAGLCEAVARTHEISRAACRRRAQRLFSEEALVERYLGIYKTVIKDVSSGRARCVSA